MERPDLDAIERPFLDERNGNPYGIKEIIAYARELEQALSDTLDTTDVFKTRIRELEAVLPGWLDVPPIPDCHFRNNETSADDCYCKSCSNEHNETSAENHWCGKAGDYVPWSQSSCTTEAAIAFKRASEHIETYEES